MEEIKKLEKELEKLKTEQKYIDANLKINYIVPIIVVMTYMFVKFNGSFELFGYNINEASASFIVSFVLLIIFFKDGVFATKQLVKKIIRLKG
jgi:hypothetical protein